MKTLIAAAVAACLAFDMTFDLAHAGPLPEAKPDEVGYGTILDFPQRYLVQLDACTTRPERFSGSLCCIATKLSFVGSQTGIASRMYFSKAGGGVTVFSAGGAGAGAVC